MLSQEPRREGKVGWALGAWLIGIPLPFVILYLIFGR